MEINMSGYLMFGTDGSKYFRIYTNLITNLVINPQAPVAPKIADEVLFRRFQGEGVDFFKSDLTDHPQILIAHLLENINLSPSRFHFSVGFISSLCFESDSFIAYSNELD